MTLTAGDRGGRRALAPHDARHGRAGAVLRAAGDARRARGAARVGARRRTSRSRRSGSARTCSCTTTGSTRSCCGSAGELAEARVEGTILVAGGGATNAVCLHRARDAGLGGFEFASAIPGTAGGGVRMNAGAYGSDWRAVVVDAVVVDADGARTARRRASSTSRTGTPRSRPARSSRRCASSSSRGRSRRSRPRSPSCSRSARRRSRRRSGRSAASSRTRRASAAPGALIEECGLKGHRIGGARDLRAARELHRERGRRDVGRRARADGRGAPAGARAVRGRARARGALPRPARAAAAVGERGRRGEQGCVARPGERPRAPRRCPRGARSRRSRGICPSRALARWSGSRCSCSPSAPTSCARETSVFAVRDVEVAGGSPALQAAGAGGARAASSAGASSRSAAARSSTGSPRSRACSRSATTAHFPHTLRVVVHARAAGARCCAAAGTAGSSRRAGACCASVAQPRVELAAARSGCTKDAAREGRRDARAARAAARRRPRSRRSPAARSRRASASVRAKDAELTLVLALGARAAARRRRRPAAEARRRAADPPARRAPRRRPRPTSTSACPSARSSAAETLKSKVEVEGYAGRGSTFAALTSQAPGRTLPGKGGAGQPQPALRA